MNYRHRRRRDRCRTSSRRPPRPPSAPCGSGTTPCRPPTAPSLRTEPNCELVGRTRYVFVHTHKRIGPRISSRLDPPPRTVVHLGGQPQEVDHVHDQQKRPVEIGGGARRLGRLLLRLARHNLLLFRVLPVLVKCWVVSYERSWPAGGVPARLGRKSSSKHPITIPNGLINKTLPCYLYIDDPFHPMTNRRRVRRRSPAASCVRKRGDVSDDINGPPLQS